MSSQLLNAKNAIFSVPSNLAALSHTDDKSSAEAPPHSPAQPTDLQHSELLRCAGEADPYIDLRLRDAYSNSFPLGKPNVSEIVIRHDCGCVSVRFGFTSTT